MIVLINQNNNRITHEFFDKKDMLDYIDSNLLYKASDEELMPFVESRGISKNFNKWTIDNLVDHFFGDFRREKWKEKLII